MASCSFSSGLLDRVSGIRLMLGVCAAAGPASSARVAAAKTAPKILIGVSLVSLGFKDAASAAAFPSSPFVPFPPPAPTMKVTFRRGNMQQQQGAEFGIADARRFLG